MDIVERLESVQGDNEDAREAAALIRDLREQIATCRELRIYDRAEIERLRALEPKP